MRSFINEDIEGKNINRAEKFIKQNYPEYIDRQIALPTGEKKRMSARDWVTQVRNDVPSSRLPKTESGKDSCKFLLGVTRLYFGFAKDGRQDEIQGKISQLEKIMKVLTTSHADEYDNDLNGISYSELDRKFKGTIQKNLDNEIVSLKDQKFERDTSYKIISIPDFKSANRFRKWTSWCVTHQKSMYDSYTKDGLGLFYFCIKDGFETVKKVVGEGCPLDEYGKSMIAISVNDDGSLNTATCRWNHDNGGNDNIFKDAKEVSEFFGVNFFETFKPRTVDELLAKYKKKTIPSKIADKLGGVETEDGLHLVNDGRVQTYKKCYDGNEGVCYAYDHFYWFDEDGNEIDAPQKVSESFSCANCASLTSLGGTPNEIDGEFSCTGCTSLTSLEGAPLKVGEDFSCSYCASLTSLEGAPQEVGRNFSCLVCESLTSLEGAPLKVGEDFSCADCTSLTSLEGAPREVGGDFSCAYCASLSSLEGAPLKVGGNFNWVNTKITTAQEQSYLQWLKTNPTENYHEQNMPESMSFICNIMRGNDDEAKSLLESMIKKKVAKRIKDVLF